MKLIDKIEQEQMKSDVPKFSIGDTVNISTRVKEGDKERIQKFQGIVIARKGRGMNELFTVRRISYGEGVERVFPLHSPYIEKIVVETVGKVRRSRLFYLRGRKGAMEVKQDKKAAAANKAAAKAKKEAVAT
jgi:large subunit ribosomal protein L19